LPESLVFGEVWRFMGLSSSSVHDPPMGLGGYLPGAVRPHECGVVLGDDELVVPAPGYDHGLDDADVRKQAAGRVLEDGRTLDGGGSPDGVVRRERVMKDKVEALKAGFARKAGE